MIFEPHLKLRTTSGGSAAGLHICIIRLHLSAWIHTGLGWTWLRMFIKYQLRCFSVTCWRDFHQNFANTKTPAPPCPTQLHKMGLVSDINGVLTPIKMAKNRLMHFPDIWYYIIIITLFHPYNWSIYNIYNMYNLPQIYSWLVGVCLAQPSACLLHCG